MRKAVRKTVRKGEQHKTDVPGAKLKHSEEGFVGT